MPIEWANITADDLKANCPVLVKALVDEELSAFDTRLDAVHEMIKDATKESQLKAETDAEAKDDAYAKVRTAYGCWEAAGKGIPMPDGLAAAVSEYAQFFEDATSVETAMVAELAQAHEGV